MPDPDDAKPPTMNELLRGVGHPAADRAALRARIFATPEAPKDPADDDGDNAA